MPQIDGILHSAVLGGMLHGLAAVEAEKRFGSAAVMASDLLAPEMISTAWHAVESAGHHQGALLELP